MRFFLNPSVRRNAAYRGLFEPGEYARVGAFYDAHPHLQPTPLVRLPSLASALSIGDVIVKHESSRFGTEAFKVAGARYAISTLGRDRLASGVVAATSGNHGRAVARSARDLGIPCTIFLPAAPAGASPIELRTRHARVAAIQADGATTVEVNGTYEEAVARATQHAADTGAVVVSDVSWPGYDEIPRLIMLGYTRIFDEASRQWDRPPDIVLVQGGVGGLVCAAANWFAMRFGAGRPFLIACEPESSACLLASARAGRLVSLADAPTAAAAPLAPTIMSGLRCAVPSPAAWPSIQSGIDAFMSIPDATAIEAIERLSRPSPPDPPIAAGPSGACGAGALLALAQAPDLAGLREACGLGQSTRAMVVVTEGP